MTIRKEFVPLVPVRTLLIHDVESCGGYFQMTDELSPEHPGMYEICCTECFEIAYTRDNLNDITYLYAEELP